MNNNHFNVYKTLEISKQMNLMNNDKRPFLYLLLHYMVARVYIYRIKKKIRCKSTIKKKHKL